MTPIENIPFISIMATMTAGAGSLLLDQKKAKKLCLGVLAMTMVLSAILFVSVWHASDGFTFTMGHFPAPFGNELYAGPFEALMALVFTGVMMFSILGGRGKVLESIDASGNKFFYLLCCMLVCSLLGLIYTDDIFTAYVFMEINMMSVCAIIVVKGSVQTNIAAIRYLIMSLLASGMILIAITLIYTITGHLLMPDILEAMTELAASGEYAFPCMMIMLLFSIGLAIKSALFPFHTWLPSAYNSATLASSCILSGIASKGYLIVILKIFYRVFGLKFTLELHVADLLFVFGMCGMIAGSLYAVWERNLKKRLAYSSVSQVGFIFMGIGLSTDIAMVAACFHIIAHAVTKPLLFLSADGLMSVSGENRDIHALNGSGRRNLIAGLGFLFGALSMIGIPMFSGFISKFYFVKGSFLNPDKMLLTLIFLVFTTVLSAMYYIPVLITIFISKEKNIQYNNERKKNTWNYSVAIVAFILVNFLLGIFFEPVIEALEYGLSWDKAI